MIERGGSSADETGVHVHDFAGFCSRGTCLCAVFAVRIYVEGDCIGDDFYRGQRK